MSTVNYNFNKEEDLGFYILNAVCHDWIHDFNKYKRMGKILNVIMSLVPPSQQSSVIQANLLTAQASETMDTTPESTPLSLQIRAEDKNINDTTALPQNEGTQLLPIRENTPVSPATEPTVYELYTAQCDQYLRTQTSVVKSITGLPPHQAIVNESINMYNKIKETTQPYQMTRGNVRKINILQKLDDFIGESQLLVISKISDNAAAGGARKKMSGGGIEIISKNHIISSINTIIKETEEDGELDTITKVNLTNIFTLLKEVFIKLEIPNISPIETLNNGIITKILHMFIVNQCKTIDITKQAESYLEILLPPPPISGKRQRREKIDENDMDNTYRKKLGLPNMKTGFFAPSSTEIFGNNFQRPLFVYSGGHFSATNYRGLSDADKTMLDAKITTIKNTILYQIYKGDAKVDNTNYSECDIQYRTFIEPINIIRIITGPQMTNAKTKEIENLSRNLGSQSGRTYIQRLQKLIDTINDFIFDKIIQPYEDIKNQENARLATSTTGSPTSLTGPAQASVQKISQLVAKKTLELTGYNNNNGTPITVTDPDLIKQIEIINNVANGRGYTTVDGDLIEYFVGKYGNKGNNIESGRIANINLEAAMNNSTTPRVINNAVQNNVIKNAMKDKVVCPTSSVCDGMGSFGSCYDPTGKKEYYNMDFNISYGDGSNYYYGTTTLKEQKRAVNITYGFNFNNFNLYNSLDINISAPPIDLQANHSFKGVVNRIVEIWKSASTTTTIAGLWGLLENDAFFISILKVGSQKAIGDIFQEINSTLENGGYGQTTDVNTKTTFGLMGDTPSGVRVVKLLKDAESGKNENAYGGYIGEAISFLYLPQPLVENASKKQRRGGKNTMKKKKTQKHAKKSIKNQH